MKVDRTYSNGKQGSEYLSCLHDGLVLGLIPVRKDLNSLPTIACPSTW